MAGTSHDLLDGNALLGETENRSIGILAVQIPFILQAFSGRQQVRINGHRANCAADLPHRLADRVEEGAAGILHQVPAVGDLDCVRESLGCSSGVGASAITGHDGYLGLPREPGLSSGWLTVWQQTDRTTTLQIADDRAVPLIATPCPVINADYRWRRHRWATASPNHAEQGVIADWQHEPPSEARARPSAEGKAKMMDETIKATGASSPWGYDTIGKAFGKNALTTSNGCAAKAADSSHELHRPTGQG